jgi:hypothetical protein
MPAPAMPGNADGQNSLFLKQKDETSFFDVDGN